VNDASLLLITGALLAGALGASLLASRLRVPGLVIVLGVGMVVGSDGFGWIHFDDYELAETIGIIALALILFEGGLAAGFAEIRPVLRPAIALATFGTILTALLTGLAAAWLFDFSTLEGLLVGSIVASTDGAAIFALLRGSTLKRRVARTLEGEAGLNDPIAVLLVLGFIDWIQKPTTGSSTCSGCSCSRSRSAGAGLDRRRARRRGAAPAAAASAGLYPVASIAIAALAYGVADVAGRLGLPRRLPRRPGIGSVNTPAHRTITTFHDGMAWLAQLALFLTLGLLVFPDQLDEVAIEGTVLAIIAAVIARPLLR
jgi:cell volume regulation protein A